MLATNGMERFIIYWGAAAKYPRSLINHNTYEYNLEAYVKRLNDREKDLFTTESQARLDFWDFDELDKGMYPVSGFMAHSTHT